MITMMMTMVMMMMMIFMMVCNDQMHQNEVVELGEVALLLLLRDDAPWSRHVNELLMIMMKMIMIMTRMIMMTMRPLFW